MQRPGFNQGYPGPGYPGPGYPGPGGPGGPGQPVNMPMHPAGPGGAAMYSQGGPTYAPGYGQPQPGHPQQNFQPNAGCFMPAATIRKISNTTPPRFDPSFQ